MKLIIYLSTFLIFSNLFSQNEIDYKDMIKDKIESNSALSNYKNYAFFNNSILKNTLNEWTDKTLTDEEYKYIFLNGREIHLGNSTNTKLIVTVVDIIDLRGVSKISMNRNFSSSNNLNYYSINLYLNNSYYATKFSIDYQNNKKNEFITKVQISISDNLQDANNIKKYLLKLFKLLNINVLDFDM